MNSLDIDRPDAPVSILYSEKSLYEFKFKENFPVIFSSVYTSIVMVGAGPNLFNYTVVSCPLLFC